MDNVRPVALFDADCGFCTRAAGWLAELGLEADIKPLQAVDLAAYGISREQALTAIAYVDPGGHVHWGHLAIGHLLLRGSWPLRQVGRLLCARWVAPLAAAVYHWVAAHRHHLPGGTPTCAMDTRPTPAQSRRD